MIEQLDDIIEQLASMAGVYGAHDDDEQRPCRICWTIGLKDRILAAVEIERKLQC